MLSKTFIYNISFHCEKEVSKEVLKSLKQELIPAWNSYKHWQFVRLLRVHLPHEELDAYTLQYDVDTLDALSLFSEQGDEPLTRLRSKFGEKMLPFSVLMQEESLDDE